MVKITDLNLAYGSEVVYDNFSCELQPNCINVIVGKSGSGKSSLLNAIAKLLPFSGEITGAERVSYVFQQPRLVPNITVFDNLRLTSAINDSEQTNRQISEMLDSVGLSALKNKLAKNLSGGQMQRVSLVRAFLSTSDVMLMDEPMQGLDAVNKQKLIETLLQLLKTNNRTVIYVTHDLYDCLSLADNIYCLTKNKLNFVASLNDEKTNRNIFNQQCSDIKKEIMQLLENE